MNKKSPSKQVFAQPSLELKKDGSVHGIIIYPFGESPSCSTYCKIHVDYILSHGWDIIPNHNYETCSGFSCYHGPGLKPQVIKHETKQNDISVIKTVTKTRKS